MNRIAKGAAIVVAAAAIGAGGGAGVYAALSPSSSTIVRQVTVAGAEPASSNTFSVNRIYDRSKDSVVEITVRATQTTPFGQQSGEAQGSGFVYDTAGHVITNAHVVDGAESVKVQFSNGKTYDATVVGSDASTDVAVLKVDAPASLLKPLTLADSSNVAVGDGVVAIGSPFGLEGTVTSGIVSALHREITSPNDFAISDAIQTDAAINHGNSGGPLLNASGQVIGINTQIESDSGGNDGVGFAVPSNTVRSIAAQLLQNGSVQHAYLGISLSGSEAKVAEVRPGTPADKAGLQAGDVISAIGGTRVTSADQLRSAIDARRPGASISLTFVRNGVTKTVQVKLASRPD
jgi:putative serine protease PepD